MSDIIYALSSGHGKSGVAVIRISGENLSELFPQMTPRHAYYKNLYDGDELIDQVIMIYFSAPNSFTGEDVIEIHSHGSPAVIKKIFEYLNGLGARIATPGEFSKRAFYNNKMDLADVDGLAALLDATTDKQRAFALKSMTGFDSKIYENWRNEMIKISAYAAAILDYPSEDLPVNIQDTVRSETWNLLNEIKNAIDNSSASRAVRNGFNVVLVGPTNAGKSSIFNRLVGANRAIVSDIHGTTRDVISAQLDIDGYLVNLLDTAGLRESSDEIEKIGIQRTHDEINNADLILRVGDQRPETRDQRPETRDQRPETR